jgi:xylulokinase
VQQLHSEEDEIYKISGNRPSTSWTLPHFLWVREKEAKIWKQVSRICLSKDYVMHWLCKEWVTDPGTACSSMLYDRDRICWSEKLCGLLGINTSQLPVIKGACQEVGVLSAEVASLLGLPEGIPLVNGSLDSATETFGAGAMKEGDVVIRIGTAGGIHRITAQPMQNRSLLTYPFPLGGFWYSQAGTNAAGSAISWAVGLSGEKESKEFEEFSTLAAQAPAGSDGVLFHPFLAGERTPYWNGRLRGTFTGLSFRHTKAHMARAVLEGVAFSLCDALSSILPKEESFDSLAVVGGGARDKLLMQILSSTLNLALIPLPFASSSYGAARMGQFAVQSAGDDYLLKESVLGNSVLQKSARAHDSVVFPVKEWVSVYQEVFMRYKSYCNVLQTLYNC